MPLKRFQLSKKASKGYALSSSEDSSKAIEGVSLRRRKTSDESYTRRPSASVDASTIRQSATEENVAVAIKRKSFDPTIPRKTSKIYDEDEGIVIKTSTSSSEPDNVRETRSVPKSLEIPNERTSTDSSQLDSPGFQSVDKFLFRNNLDSNSPSSIAEEKVFFDSAKTNSDNIFDSDFQDVLNYLQKSDDDPKGSGRIKKRNAVSLSEDGQDSDIIISSFEDSGEFSEDYSNTRVPLRACNRGGTVPVSLELSKSVNKPSSKRILFRRSLSECERKTNKKCEPRSQSLKHKIFRHRSSSRNSEDSLFKGLLRKSKKQRSRSGDTGGSPWHSRGRTEESGGSAPTSPQTGTKLQKLSFWRRSSSKQEKRLNESSESLGLPEKEVLSKLTSTMGTSPIASSSPLHCPRTNQLSDDELRRENSLKIRIQEAKGVPDKKRYHCVLLVNGIEVHETSTKYKDGLCFWGEQFEVFDIQQFKKVGIKLIRDERKVIGLAEFQPVESITDPKLDEWIKISLEKPSKEKDEVAIRIRYTFRCVTILPLKEYKCFIKYLNNSSLSLCKKLETQLNAKSKEDFLTSLVAILYCYQKSTSFMGQLIKNDVEQNGENDKTMFRANSMATKAIEAYMRLVGQNYLENTLKNSINFLLQTNKEFEVDSCKIQQDSNVSIEERRKNLLDSVQSVWGNIMSSATGFPEEIRSVFFVVRENLKNPEMADRIISASVFLRLLCPSVMSPTLFGLTKEYPYPAANRRLTLVAKTLQTLANFSTFQSKEDYMQFLNPFIEREQSNCRKFLMEISGPGFKCNSSVEDQENQKDIYVGRHLALLHLHLKGILETIEIQSFDSDIRHLSTQINHVNDQIKIQERLLAQREKEHAMKLLQPAPFLPLAGFSPQTLKRSFSETPPKSNSKRDDLFPPRFVAPPPPPISYQSSERTQPASKISSEAFDTRRTAASDLSTSDNYVLQSALTNQSYNSYQNDNSPPNNNDHITDPVSQEMRTNSESNHKTVEKSLST